MGRSQAVLAGVEEQAKGLLAVLARVRTGATALPRQAVDSTSDLDSANLQRIGERR